MSEEFRKLALEWLDRSAKEKVGSIQDRCLLRALVYATLDVGESLGELQSTMSISSDTVYPEN